MKMKLFRAILNKTKKVRIRNTTIASELRWVKQENHIKRGDKLVWTCDAGQGREDT